VEKVPAAVRFLKRTGVDGFLYRSFNLHHPIHIVRRDPHNRNPETPAFDFNPCGIIDQQIDPERGWIFRTGHLFARRHSIVPPLIDYTA